MHKPLYPEHGQVYLQAMLEAAEEYDAWVETRTRKGITIYSRKQQEEE